MYLYTQGQYLYTRIDIQFNVITIQDSLDAVPLFKAN
jgi:hypothetical protein